MRHAPSAETTRPVLTRVAYAILLTVGLVLGLALVTAGLARAGF